MKNILVLCFCFIAFAVLAFDERDFQVTIRADEINRLMSQAMCQADLIDSPRLTFYSRNRFQFSCMYYKKIIFWRWRPVTISGVVQVSSQGDLDIGLSSGVAGNCDWDISRWLPMFMQDAVCRINSTPMDPQYKVQAQYLPTNCLGGSCVWGALRLKISKKVILQGMSDVRLKHVIFHDGFVTVSSTDNMAAYHKADVEGFLGVGIIREALKAVVADAGSDGFSVKDLEIKLSQSKADLTFDVVENGQGTKVTVNTGIENGNQNLVKLILLSVSAVTENAAEQADPDLMLGKIVTLINNNLKKLNITAQNGVMQLGYDAKKAISFRIDFKHILVFKLQPQIFNIDLQNGYISVAASID
ncbi:MAG: hypothetical protein PHQ23_06310 [Candidatus Wallbacteria bacterium]|nr:hypothetical protein [Candidatus Wallbacteria bacterium]